MDQMQRSPIRRIIFGLFASAVCVHTSSAEPLRLPTANHALFEKGGGGEKFFVGTTGKPWMSGEFGCVRSDGGQMHEGLDIRCLQRDKRGEPIDPVMATADGTVVYFNKHPGLSNFGNYVVVRHHIDGIEVYSVYAHLSEVLPALRVGQAVKAGEQIAVMGRTSNTHERITKERAHVHFELNLLANDNYSAWHKKFLPSQKNDHGEWNGQNLLGIDPREVLLRQNAYGEKFNLVTYLQSEPELCRVFVRKTNFPWVKRYAALILKNPVAEKNGIAGYELALDFNGVPVRAIPRSAAEIKGNARFQLLAVNEAEEKKNPCRHLVSHRGSSWQLTHHGEELLELLTY